MGAKALRQAHGVFRAFESRGNNRLVLAVSILALSALIWFWCSPFSNSVFALDDPRLIVTLAEQLDRGTLLTWVFTDTFANRWRPITNLLQAGAYVLFGNDFFGWWFLNVLVVNLLAVGLFFLLLLLSGQIWAALALTVAFETSRFLQYNVTQSFGLMESFSLLLLVGILWFTAKRITAGGTKPLFGLVSLFGILVFTHERFATLWPALVLVFFLDRRLSRTRQLFFSFVISLPLFLMVAVKLFVFKIPLFVGTGSATEVGFLVETTVQHSQNLIMNLFGINAGPAYLMGRTIESQPALAKLATVLIFLTFALLLAWSMKLIVTQARFGHSEKLKFAGISGLIFICLAIPTVITIRLEPRWLSSMLLVAFAWISFVTPQRFGRKKIVGSVLILFSLVSVAQNQFYWRNFDNSYFRSAQLSGSKYLNIITPTWEEQLKTKEPKIWVEAANNPNAALYFSQLVAANSTLKYLEAEVVEPDEIQSILESGQGAVILYNSDTDEISISK